MKRAGLVLLGLAAALALCEAAARALSMVKPELFRPFSFPERPHPYTGFDNKFDRSIGTAENSNDVVVLLLGGSTAFGVGASARELTIPVRLQAHLNERNPWKTKIPRFTVLNAACPDFHTTQEKHRLEDILFARRKIDLVVCLHGYNNLSKPFENDWFRLPLNYPGWMWGVVHEHRRRYLYHFGRFFAQATRHSALGKFKTAVLFLNTVSHRRLFFYFKSMRAEAVEGIRQVPDDRKRALMREGIRLYEQDVRQMKRLGDDHGFRIMFVLQPLLATSKKTRAPGEKAAMEQRPGDVAFKMAGLGLWAEAQRELIAVGVGLRKRGLDVVSLDNIFDGVVERAFMDLMHLTDLGQDLVARAMADRILKEISSPPGRVKIGRSAESP